MQGRWGRSSTCSSRSAASPAAPKASSSAGRAGRQLVVLRGTVCSRCGYPTAWPVERCGECAGRRISFASARAAVAYNEVARALVGAWKERGLRRLAELAADLVVDVVPRPRASVLAHVPGEPDRVGWRGVDAARELTAALGRRWELPVEPLLARTRHVRRQRGLSGPGAPGERPRSLPAPAAGCRGTVALVDDVHTTGAAAWLPRPSSGGRVRQRCTSSHSPVSCGVEGCSTVARSPRSGV